MSTRYFDTEGIYFIAYNPQGKTFCAQVGGTSCTQVSITGTKYTWVKQNPQTTKYFNPNWWYNQYHWFKEGVFGKELKQFTVQGLNPGNLWEAESRASTGFHWRRSADFATEAARMDNWRKKNPVFIRYQRRAKALERALLAHPKFTTYQQLNQGLARAINRIKPFNVEKVTVISPVVDNSTKVTMPVGVPAAMFGSQIASTEAWIYVLVTYKNQKQTYGVITWQNCD
jgi:hypothetical protein